MLAADDFSGLELKEPLKITSVPALGWCLHCRELSCVPSLCEVQIFAVLLRVSQLRVASTVEHLQVSVMESLALQSVERGKAA